MEAYTETLIALLQTMQEIAQAPHGQPPKYLLEQKIDLMNELMILAQEVNDV